MKSFEVFLYRLRYWLPSEREALLRRLEMATEYRAIDFSSACRVWQRETPLWWLSLRFMERLSDASWKGTCVRMGITGTP